MLTVKAAAERAGVSAGLIYDWVSSKRLPHFRLGREGSRGSIRIAEADLEALLDSLRHGDRPKDTILPTPKTKVVLKHVRVKKG